MAKNEIFKYGQWISLPLPFRGPDPRKNDDPTESGDPVLIGSIVGFAQEVGGKPVHWPGPGEEPGTFQHGSSVSWTISRNTANSTEPGWASIALVGAFAYPVEGWDPTLMGSGTPVGIIAATATTRARLVANAEGDSWFGTIVGQTKSPMVDKVSNLPLPNGAQIPIVNVVQPPPGRVNTVADRAAFGS